MKTKFDKYDKFKSSQAHIRYTKGIENRQVPGITTITKFLSEVDPIAIWSNNLGLANINMVEYRRELAVIGTAWHEMIECQLMNKTFDKSEYTERQLTIANRMHGKFISWSDKHVIEPVAMEIPLVSFEHNYGGTGDYYGYIDGKMTYMDFKSTDTIKMEHHVQAVACSKLWNDHHPDKPIEVISIFKATRSIDMSYEYVHVGSIDKKWNLFLTLLSVHEQVNSIKKED